MKLLMYGHWSDTGFGVVTKELGERFVAAGFDVRVLAYNHRGEPVEGPLAGRVYPLEFLEQKIDMTDARGIEGSLWTRLGVPWKPEAVFVIADVSGLMGYVGQAIDYWRKVPVWHYCPIEGDNLPPAWRDVWNAFQPVSMSEFGRQTMTTLLGRDVPMIYHGVDTATFRPITPGRPLTFEGSVLRTQDDCKVKFNIPPDRKILFRADRNAIRKRYDVTFRAFAEIAAADPDVDLVLHCQPIDIEGIDLWQELHRLPEDIRPRIKFTGLHNTFKGLSPDGLCALYNAADIYFSTTAGEGFGLTLAESLACETPVVTTGWAAEREVVAEGGVLVDPLIDRYGEVVRDHSRFGMDWCVPDYRGFVEPTLRLLSRSSWRERTGAAGRAHIMRTFSWDVAAASFIDLFEDTDGNRVALGSEELPRADRDAGRPAAVELDPVGAGQDGAGHR